MNNYTDKISGLFIKDQKKTVKNTKYSTGHKALDAALNGGFNSKLCVLKTPNNIIKSDIALELAEGLSKSTDVLYFSIDWDNLGVLLRILANILERDEIYLSSNDFKFDAADIPCVLKDEWRETCSEESYEYLIKCCDKISDINNLYIFSNNLEVQDEDIILDNQEEITIDAIFEIIKTYKESMDSDRPIIVFIDYLQLLMLNSEEDGDAILSKLSYIKNYFDNVQLVVISSIIDNDPYFTQKEEELIKFSNLVLNVNESDKKPYRIINSTIDILKNDNGEIKNNIPLTE